MPRGPNSRANDCDNARVANLQAISLKSKKCLRKGCLLGRPADMRKRMKSFSPVPRIQLYTYAKLANFAPPFMAAVAPVKKREPPLPCLVMAASEACANINAPTLRFGQYGFVSTKCRVLIRDMKALTPRRLRPATSGRESAEEF